MIQITVYESGAGEVVGIKARGHAGDSPRGESIVCASISTIFEMLFSSGKDFPQEVFEYIRKPRKPEWKLVVDPERLSEQQWSGYQKILEAAREVIQKITENHSEHCEIVDTRIKE